MRRLSNLLVLLALAVLPANAQSRHIVYSGSYARILTDVTLSSLSGSCGFGSTPTPSQNFILSVPPNSTVTLFFTDTSASSGSVAVTPHFTGNAQVADVDSTGAAFWTGWNFYVDGSVPLSSGPKTLSFTGAVPTHYLQGYVTNGAQLQFCLSSGMTTEKLTAYAIINSSAPVVSQVTQSDPCQSQQAVKQTAPIAVSGNTTPLQVSIIAPIGGGSNVFVCGVHLALSAGGAGTQTWQFSTTPGASCSSATLLTGAILQQATTPVSLDADAQTQFTSPTANSLCSYVIITGGVTVTDGGYLVFVVQ